MNYPANLHIEDVIILQMAHPNRLNQAEVAPIDCQAARNTENGVAVDAIPQALNHEGAKALRAC